MQGPLRSHWVFHCDGCGRDKTLAFDVLGAVLARAPLGAGPFDLGRTSDHGWARALRPRRARLREQVERLAGRCACGGAYNLDAPARCPQCRSADLLVEPGGVGCVRD